NTNGTLTTTGVLFDQPADGFTGFTFNVDTYPGLKELNDRAFEALRDRLYAAFPQYARAGVLDNGPQGLDQIYPGLYAICQGFGGVPDLFTAPFVPFQFHVVASSTSMSRSEFVAYSLTQAEKLRQGILADATALPALSTLAANRDAWGQLYLASLEEAGLLRPDGQAP